MRSLDSLNNQEGNGPLHKENFLSRQRQSANSSLSALLNKHFVLLIIGRLTSIFGTDKRCLPQPGSYTMFIHLMLVASAIFFVGAIVPLHAQETLRIGAPLPLTGALSPEGTKLRQGYDLWLEKVNAGGGVKVGDKKLKV